MDFSYNENQKMIADMIQQFGKQNIEPFVREWDDNQIFPVDVFKKLGELGDIYMIDLHIRIYKFVD